MIKLSTKVYHYKNSIDGPGSVDLTPRSFRADGQYTAERTVVFPYVRGEEDRIYRYV